MFKEVYQDAKEDLRIRAGLAAASLVVFAQASVAGAFGYQMVRDEDPCQPAASALELSYWTAPICEAAQEILP